ncbi:MAG TPA: VOC family protein [Balneolales bacterium]|nr:VOC family protein [Balneolales bacterium]
MESNFSVLTLGVDDLERSFHFYHEGLGFPSGGIVGKEFERGAVAFFDLKNGVKLAIYPRKDLAWDANISENPPAASEFSIGYIAKNKEEVDSIMALAKKAGAIITKPATKAFWGGYHGYFQDQDGHLWEILWSPQLTTQD